MDQSVVINPSGDFRPSSKAVPVSSEAGHSGGVVVAGVASKKSETPYRCQHCGRFCRNAQALGGHMNVHRPEREVAKLLLELRYQGTNVGMVGNSEGKSAAECMEEGEEEEHLHHGGLSSVSSSSPCSPCSPPSEATGSPLVHPWKRPIKQQEQEDLELRVSFRKFL